MPAQGLTAAPESHWWADWRSAVASAPELAELADGLAQLLAAYPALSPTGKAAVRAGLAELLAMIR